MKRARAFTLCELLIYVALSLGLIAAVVAWTHNMVAQLLQVSKQVYSNVCTSALIDRIRGDIRALAHSEQYHVSQENKSNVVWRTYRGDVGWLHEKGSVWRIAGTYDFTKATWINSSKALVARNIELFSINSNRSERLMHIEVREHGHRDTMVCEERIYV